MSDCLLSHYAGATVDAWRGEPEIGGRFFYNSDFNGFNFERQRLRLDAVLDTLKQHADDPRPPGDLRRLDHGPTPACPAFALTMTWTWRPMTR